MRRNFLGSLLLAGLAPAVDARTVTTPGASRILGTWKLDAERTSKNWRFPPGADESIRARFAALMDMTWRVTATALHVQDHGRIERTPYRVIAADYACVVIAHRGDGVAVVEQIFLEDGYFYKAAAGYNIEFFRKIA